MAVRKAGRCRITVGGREFVWWLPNEAASLHIASGDKAFAVAYQLYHPMEAEPLLRIYGRDFPGLGREKRPVYVVPPRFQHWYSFKGLARRIIQWSLEDDHTLIRASPMGGWTF